MSKYQPYPDYQPVDIDWIDAIPSHWKTSKMRYMFSFGKGLTITKDNLKDDGIPCVNYGEVHSKFGFEVTPHKHALKCVDESYLKSGSSSLLKKGDLVFADTSEDIDGSGNFTQLISDSPVFAGYHTIIARPYDRECYRFFAYLIDAKELRTQIRHAVKGVKVFSITQAILRSVNIWLPPLEERKQIAAFLDHETAKIDTLIEKQQQLIELLKEKRQAVISHAVTKGLNPDAPMKDSGVEWLGEVPEHWVISSIKYLSSFVGTGGTPKDDSSFTENEDICWFTPGDFKGTLTISRSNKYVTKQSIARNDAKIYPRDSVLIIGIGATLGKVALCKYDFSCNQQINIVTPNEKIKSNFLAYALNIQIEQMKLQSNSSTIGIMNQEKTKQIVIAVPPINEQISITSYINNVLERFDKLLLKANKQIDLLQERRTALISAAVTGKIDVRNWVVPATSSDTNEAQQEMTA